MKFALGITILLGAAGCASDSLPPSGHLNQSLGLSPAGLKRHMELADRGDGEAAYRVSTHYAFYMQDDAEGQKWMRRASDLGLPKAQSALGRRLVNEPSDASKAKGLALIRASAEAGDEMSLRFLNHLRYLQTFPEEDLKRVQHRVPGMIDLIRFLERAPREISETQKEPNQSSQPPPRRG